MEEFKRNKKRKKSWLEVIIWILLPILLWVTNPNQQDFEIFLQQEQVKNSFEQVNIEASMTDLFAETTDSFDDQLTKRGNYMLFSLYLVKGIDSGSHIYIGFFQQFARIVELDG